MLQPSVPARLLLLGSLVFPDHDRVRVWDNRCGPPAQEKGGEAVMLLLHTIANLSCNRRRLAQLLRKLCGMDRSTVPVHKIVHFCFSKSSRNIQGHCPASDCSKTEHPSRKPVGDVPGRGSEPVKLALTCSACAWQGQPICFLPPFHP